MWYFTPEMVAKAQAEHEAKLAALTPEEKAWLSAESDWLHTMERREEQSRHARAKEFAALLEADIKEFGCPSR